MKIEKPPQFELNIEYIQQIWSGKFRDFFIKSDEKYFYWDDIKYKKDMPFKLQIENWTLLKTYRQSKYEKYKYTLPVSIKHFFCSNKKRDQKY